MWPKKEIRPNFIIRINNYETQPFPLENPGRFVLIAKPLAFESHNHTIQSTAHGTVDALNLNSFSNIYKKNITVLISGGNQNPVTIVVRKYQYGDSVAK